MNNYGSNGRNTPPNRSSMYYTGKKTPKPSGQGDDFGAQYPDYNRKGGSNKKKVLIGCVIGVLVVALGITCAAAYNIIYNPKSLFEKPVAQQTIQTPKPAESDKNVVAGPNSSPSPSPQPTPDYLQMLREQADMSEMKDVFNVLLVGVDYADERLNNDREYVDKNFNSDVMMLLAVNMDENRVDMLSVPRDTYAKIHNADGKYKLNFSFTLGGGLDNPDSAFMNVCKSVEGVLGGVPVDYYVGVTMPMLKEVVDLIGGVDFDVDIPFTIQGRKYEKGMQHLDGQGVLDYCRTRKQKIDPGDDNRINRQKKMMLAVFDKMRKETPPEGIIPLINTLTQNVYTNLNFGQLAALANFGLGLDLDNNVELHSFSGPRVNIFNYGYECLDQQKRVDLIKEVYNADVEKQPEYGVSYARWEWADWQIREIIPRIQKALDDNDYSADTQSVTTVGDTVIPAVYDEYGNVITPEQIIPGGYAYSYGPSDIQTTMDSLIALHASSKEGENGKEMLEMLDELQTMCKNAGLNVNWRVDVYKDVAMAMKE